MSVFGDRLGARTKGTDVKLDRYLEAGREALDRGKNSRALAEFEKANKEAEGGSAVALQGLALASFRLGDYEATVNYGKSVLGLDISSLDRAIAHNLVGLGYWGKSYYGKCCPSSETREDLAVKAEQSFRAAIEFADGRLPIAWLNLADALEAQCDYSGAEEAVMGYLKHDPENEPARARLGELQAMDQVLEELWDDPGCAYVERRLGPDFFKADEDRRKGYTAPRKVRAPAPKYTADAQDTGLRGTAVIGAMIDSQGDICAVRILRDLPLGLGKKAAAAVKGWKFDPATLDGEPIAVTYRLTFTFR